MDPAHRKRYLAATRRDTRTAAFAAGVTVVVIFLVDQLMPGQPPSRLVINLCGAALGSVVLLALRGPLRRRPDVAAFVLGTIGLGSVLLTISTAYMSARFLMVAWFGLLVVAMALFLPWDARRHSLFLAMCYACFVLTISSPLAGQLEAEYRDSALAGGLSAVLVSSIGHAVAERRRRRAFVSEQLTRSLNRRARANQRELSRLNAELEVVSRVDPLTGVGNRLRLEEDVRAVRSALSRSGGVGAVALVDVDHFKRYNDRFGHVAGDEVLRALGSTLGGNLRAGDGVYRFGGEEFLLLLPGADLATARTIVERLGRAIEALAMPHPGNEPWGVVTVSAGIATLGPGSDSDDWLRSADSALYRAKEGGRNATGLVAGHRVRVYRPRRTAFAPGAA